MYEKSIADPLKDITSSFQSLQKQLENSCRLPEVATNSSLVELAGVSKNTRLAEVSKELESISNPSLISLISDQLESISNPSLISLISDQLESISNPSLISLISDQLESISNPSLISLISDQLESISNPSLIIENFPFVKSTKISKEFAEFGKIRNLIPELSTRSILPTLPSLNFRNIIIPRPVDSILPLIPDIRRTPPPNTDSATITDEVPDKKRIFIGHGHSDCWKELRDFVTTELRLFYDEFNRSQTAGLPISKRLEQMLEETEMAFLIMTAQNKYADGTLHASNNVIHEIGLFQGKLGFKKAIILLEEGCEEFSNIHGLVQIRFPKGNIKAAFENIREVLKREGILS